jgi:hypothetical protein
MASLYTILLSFPVIGIFETQMKIMQRNIEIEYIETSTDIKDIFSTVKRYQCFILKGSFSIVPQK